MKCLQRSLRNSSFIEPPSKESLIKRIPFLKQDLLKAVSVVCLFWVICGIITSHTHLGECASDSLEEFKYALFLKTSSFDRTDIVLIRNHSAQYGGEKYRGDIAFAKRIVGMPGDLLHRDKERICVFSLMQKEKPLDLTPPSFSQRGAVHDLGAHHLPLLDQTTDGKPLTPLKAKIVPEGYVFVAGDHPRSFDSRYEEFGLVPQEKIWGKALLTW